MVQEQIRGGGRPAKGRQPRRGCQATA